MRILTALIAAGLLAVAVVGCHHEKQPTTTPTGNMGDAGTQPAQPVYPPAQ